MRMGDGVEGPFSTKSGGKLLLWLMLPDEKEF